MIATNSTGEGSRTVRAAIFDVDGTLIDSNDAHAHAWADAFREFGVEQDFEAIRSQIGKGGDQLLPVFLTREQIEKFGAVLEETRKKIFTTTRLPHLKAFPKTRELFEKILADQKQIVLASSASGSELEAYQKIARIDDLIDDSTSKDDAEKSKPHPDIFEAALKKLHGVQNREAIVIGDTPFDARAATMLRLRMIGLLCGGFRERDLREAGCIAIYQDPADLLDRYETSLLAT